MAGHGRWRVLADRPRAGLYFSDDCGGCHFGLAIRFGDAPNADYLPARADWIIALSAYRSSFRAQCAATTGCAHAATRKADHRGLTAGRCSARIIGGLL